MRYCCAIEGRYFCPLLLFLLLSFLFTGLSGNVWADCCAKTGLFPNDPTMLREQVDGFINLIPAQPFQGKVYGLFLPGENYLVAGNVMGVGYQLLLEHSFDEIVIFVEDRSLPKGIWIPRITRFFTPLGTVSLSKQFADEILKKSNRIQRTRNCPPPSFWYQLPFLQRIFGLHRILPILVNGMNLQTIESVAGDIAPAFKNKRVLLIAVSNLSSGNDLISLGRLDHRSVQRLADIDYRNLWNESQSGTVELSGLESTVFAMILAKKMGANKGKLLRHIATSGLPVEKHTGMAALVWYDESHSDAQKKSVYDMTVKDGELLWEIANATIMGKSEPKTLDKLKNISTGVFIQISRHDSIIARVGDLFTTLTLDAAVRKFAGLLKSYVPINRTMRCNLSGSELSVCVAKPIDGVSIPSPDMGIYIKLGSKIGLLFPGEGSDLPPKQRMGNACLQAGIASKSWCVPETNVHFFTLKVFSGQLSK